MAPVTTAHASNALRLMAEAAADRQLEIDQHSSQPLPDDDPESSSPVFDTFVESGGSAAVHQMTNFIAGEFNYVLTRIDNFVASKWNQGRGRKSERTGKDNFFMTLTVLKHSGTSDFLGRMFDIKGLTFERLITRFVLAIWQDCYDELVMNIADRIPLVQALRQRRMFKYHPTARYATDVTFQHANRRSGNMQEGNRYYSGKHKLYGYKVEVSVTPFGMANLCSHHYPGYTADIDISYKMMYAHRIFLKKSEKEKSLVDTGLLFESYPTTGRLSWTKDIKGQLTTCERSILSRSKRIRVFLKMKKIRTRRNQAIGLLWKSSLVVTAHCVFYSQVV